MQMTLEAAAEKHGQVVDYRKLGKRLLISDQAVKRRIKDLETEGIIRLLPPFRQIDGKKIIKRAKLYIRNPESLKSLIPERAEKNQETQGSAIEKIIERESLRYPFSRFYHYSKYSGLSVDLVVERGDYCFGLLCNLSDSFRMCNQKPLRSAIKDGVIQRGIVLHSYYQAFFVSRYILAVPLAVFLAAYEDWTKENSNNYDLQFLMRWVNIAQCTYELPMIFRQCALTSSSRKEA